MLNNKTLCILIGVIFFIAPAQAYVINEPLHEIELNHWKMNITFASTSEKNKIIANITRDKNINIKDFNYTLTGTLTYEVTASLIDYSQKFNLFCGTCSVWYMNGSWLYAQPLLINNTLNAATLLNYQVPLYITWDSNMSTSGADFRIANNTDYTLQPYWIDRLNSTNSSFFNLWINISKIPGSVWTNTTYSLYYGNASAVSVSDKTGTFENAFLNPSFESGTGWTYSAVDPLGGCSSNLNSLAWATSELYSYYQSCGYAGSNSQAAYGQESQTIAMPAGYTYKIIFDNNASQMTAGYGYTQVVNGTIIISNITTTGVRLNQQTVDIPSGTQTVRLRTGIYGGSITRWGQAAYDNIRVRKYSAPEPYQILGSFNAYLQMNVTDWGNNKTNNHNLTFSTPLNIPINMNVTTNVLSDLTNWTVNGVDQGWNYNNFTYTAVVNNLYLINSTSYNSTYNNYDYKNWSYTGNIPTKFIREYEYTLG